MRTSEIESPGSRPLAPFNVGYYRQSSREALAAMVRANPEVSTAVPHVDTSHYEFPGDLTYSRYLSSGGA